MEFPTRAGLRRAAAVAVLAALGSAPLAAQVPARVNLGTLAPRGSSYHQALQVMAEAWKKAPGGGTKVVIYPDGTQGSEEEMVKLMRVGTLHAGLLTSAGLSAIDRDVTALQEIPMAFRSMEEYQAVLTALSPMLERRLEAKGFTVLFWATAGWLRPFTVEPRIEPEDFKRAKLFVWAGDDNQMQVMRKHGFTPVALQPAEILTGLQGSMITAVTVPPIFALATQIDSRAKHMLELNYVPLVGALVVRKAAWDKFPEETKSAMLAAAREAGAKIRGDSLLESDRAVEAMRRRGLTVHVVSPELEQRWRKSLEELYPDIRGTMVPAELFDQVLSELRSLRSKSGAGSQ
jgi:TRAP-type C4-dicarboxylate transport system substrate-binding protein